MCARVLCPQAVGTLHRSATKRRSRNGRHGGGTGGFDDVLQQLRDWRTASLRIHPSDAVAVIVSAGP